ncbi:MAG: hypothetical protein E7L06_08515 [Schaalia turicensis]|nr:hypothetical protein [Schaalia turicensis]
MSSLEDQNITEWQLRYPLRTVMVMPGRHGIPDRLVRVGKASRQGVRVKHLDGPCKGQWITVHPDDLEPLPDK